MGKIYVKDVEHLKSFAYNSFNNHADINILTISSGKIIWWECDKGHSWKQKIYTFANNPSCPFCSDRKVWSGFNDLATKFPKFAKQWNYQRNDISISPEKIIYKSSQKVWWICDKGHEWQSVIKDRTRADKKASIHCPYCSGKRVLKGFNDLETILPYIASQWNYEKNSITPDEVTLHSGKKVWWICDKGHEWEASICDRTRTDSKATNCPYCNGKKVLKGFNDLSTVNPEIAKQWHPTKNGDLKPEHVTIKSGKKVWWVCDKGHEWEIKVASRSNGNNCPVCVNQKILNGINDLSTVNPEIAKQWHPTKNGDLTPNMVSVGANRKVWWICNKGHEWEATCGDRNYGYGCLKCSNGYSKKEEEIQKMITSWGFKIETNARNIVKGELDIYIPEKKIAVEYNGLYWHSESNCKDKYYHYNKWLACKELGIQLIQIWEDDYARSPELVKNMLAHKLGVSRQPKIYARQTIIKTLTKQEADAFLNDSHIQGSVDGKIRVALISESKPVAVMVLKTEAGSDGKILNLLRYATNANVIGGFTKLLTWVEHNSPEITGIVTFSDNTLSDGRLYANNGFTLIKQLEPDYMYINRKTREHKFNYRLKRFKTDPNLQWVDGLSEKELAKLNNLPRIWDAGKTKWGKTLNPTVIKQNKV